MIFSINIIMIHKFVVEMIVQTFKFELDLGKRTFLAKGIAIDNHDVCIHFGPTFTSVINYVRIYFVKCILESDLRSPMNNGLEIKEIFLIFRKM